MAPDKKIRSLVTARIIEPNDDDLRYSKSQIGDLTEFRIIWLGKERELGKSYYSIFKFKIQILCMSIK